jgi:hypothetical protein
MLEQPAAENALEVIAWERDFIGATENDIDSEPLIGCDYFRGVIDCHDVGKILLRKPATAGSEIQDRA